MDEKPNATITAQEARTLIEQEERRQSEACLKELNAVLERYERRLVAVAFLASDGRTQARVDIVRIER